MNDIYLLTGGNLGDRELHLREAAIGISALAADVGRDGSNFPRAGVTAASALYRTAAWGKEDQPDFLNQALRICTPLPPLELLDRLQQLEQRIGRVRLERYGPRVIDIDILLYNGLIMDEPRLSVPHPQLPHRRFALMPLAEIAPALIHPVTGKSITQMLMECDDPLPVERYP